MKNVVIKNLFAVGMHHHGGRELPIDIPMFCSPEPTNKWDPKGSGNLPRQREVAQGCISKEIGRSCGV